MQPDAAPSAPANPRNHSEAVMCVAIFALLALLVYAFPLIDLVRACLAEGLNPGITQRDYANFWMAGQLVRLGDQQELFFQDVYYAHLKQVFGAGYELRAWSYPPHSLLFVWPLGFIGYKAGLAL